MAKKIREIVLIDEELCDGCGDCIISCVEGAIQIIDCKAKLVSDNLCDGFGNCLGVCPQGAITIEKREAENYEDAAVHVGKAVDMLLVVGIGAGALIIAIVAYMFMKKK